MQRKGIILAGGSGTRLYPLTRAVSKQLMPVYDKPMIYYPLSVLMLAGIREIVVISTPTDLPNFQRLLGDGSQWGISLSYIQQPKPEGLAQALILAEDFLDNSPSCLILGDNLFYGQSFPKIIQDINLRTQGATIFGYRVSNPKDYGVVEFDNNLNVISLEEKPAQPKSHYAVPGLYFYDHRASQLARTIQPSSRGELEITDLNKLYLKEKQLRVELIGRGTAWLDTGNPDTLLQASLFVQAIQQRQGLKIACLEEIAYHQGWIKKDQLICIAQDLHKTEYGQYLLNRFLQES